MNFWKPLALVSTASLIFVVGYQSANAGPAGGAAKAIEERQPNMEAALASLQAARASLDRAEHDKGGWRGAAIKATDAAIVETKRGMAFADKH